MVYEYDDLFIVNSIDQAELERYETRAIIDIEKLGISDSHFVERLVIARTYVIAARAQLEADGMEEKLRAYRDEYDQAMKEALIAERNVDGIKDKMPMNIKVGRS